MKNFSILNFEHKTARAIKAATKALGDAKMKKASHGFNEFGAIPIIRAAQLQAQERLKGNQHLNVAIEVVGVVLAANRKYNVQVEPRIREIRDKSPDLTLLDLNQKLKTMNYQELKEFWGHADEKKYTTLKSLVSVLLSKQFVEYLSKRGMNAAESKTDLERLQWWAKNADLKGREQDPIGQTKNVGIATFQHLRIVFGANTVKPDQRVREVLERKFGAKLSPELAIVAVEEIAKLTGFSTIFLDQIFVKYGSGYFTASNASGTRKARFLKACR